jgi:site-specific DNA-methyltransferase (adenine-specific)
LAFADPPFNIGYEYDVYDDRRRAEEYLAWSREWMAGVHDALRPDGTFWLAIGDEYAAELKVIAQREVGFTCRSWVIWYYTFGVNCRRGFSRSHTHLFHFIKDPAQFTFNESNPAVRVPSARQLVYADARANPRGRLPDNTWILRPQDLPDGFAAEQDTWYFPRVAGTFKEREGFHGCQMPEQLLGRIIRTCSNPTEVVLDPFAGSGTTLAVAKKLGRQWIGFELSEQYAARVNQRLADARVGAPLDGAENPLASAPSTSQGKQRKPQPATAKRKTQAAIRHEQELEDQAAGVLQAYRATHLGYAMDYVLTDPDLNAAFTQRCQQDGVPGDPVAWNRTLLELGNQRKLPKGSKRRPRISLAKLDCYSFASEVALQQISLEVGTTLDGILCDPELAARFDQVARRMDPGQHTSSEYRWAAWMLQKNAEKAEPATEEQFRRLGPKLPRPVSLERWKADKFEHPGVYALHGPNATCLYVGGTLDVGRQVARLATSPAWSELQPSSVTVWEAEEDHVDGLKSILIQRLNPILNSRLPFSELAAAS